MVARHGPESWPGMLRNWWPASTGIRTAKKRGRMRDVRTCRLAVTDTGFVCGFDELRRDN